MHESDVAYIIDGHRIHSMGDFYTVVGEAVNGPGGYFGGNLDAFADCLTGGYGTPDDGRFHFIWQYSDASRHALGYPETIRQLKDRLAHCHPDHRPRFRRELELAVKAEGPTVFDWFVDVFDFRGVRLELE